MHIFDIYEDISWELHIWAKKGEEKSNLQINWKNVIKGQKFDGPLWPKYSNSSEKILDIDYDHKQK